VRTKLLKFKPNILDEAGPRSGSGDVRILRPSLNSLRSLCSSVLQRLGPSITRSPAITRFSARIYQWYDSVFSRLLSVSLAMSDNSVKCCKQTTYSSICALKKQVLSSAGGRKFPQLLASQPKLNECHAPVPESANQPGLAEALGISLILTPHQGVLTAN
jgi:hypothetical protein